MTSTACTGVSVGGYVNPFAHAANLVPQRIDMGVGYDGNGPIDAIGAARITFAGTDPGWAGGNSVNYQLLTGPYRGRNVYVAEAVDPTVTTGQTIAAEQQIATFGHGFSSNSIETGWASGPGRPGALANLLHQADYSGGDTGSYRTFCGQQFSDVLHALGGPRWAAEPAAIRSKLQLTPLWARAAAPVSAVSPRWRRSRPGSRSLSPDAIVRRRRRRARAARRRRGGGLPGSS